MQKHTIPFVSFFPLRISAIFLQLICVIMPGFALRAQDAELTNYKSGIDVTWGGTKGTAYQEEYWYHDKLISDTKAVWIRDNTTITFGHNARNIASVAGRSKVVVGASGGGQVRYKIDGIWQELQWAPNWDGSGTTYPAYSSSFDLDSTGTVGVTGYNSGGSYWQGMIDSAGDEWHVMIYADDDSTLGGFDDSWASDGKWVLFCVNPITPAMTVRSSGSGQFYTTPAWTYWTAKIHDQTTCFQGTCTFELNNIYGGNISYRINGGSTVDVGSATVTLDEGDFSDGSNTLEYWYTSTPSVKRTRTIVENPGFPSASEDHGERTLGGSSGWTAFQSRATRAPYSTSIATAQTASGSGQSLWDGKARSGLRFGGSNWPHNNYHISTNAIMAKYLGWTATRSGASKSYAEYAKEMLLEAPLTQSIAGCEISYPASMAIPCADLIYRGYWDADFAYGAAMSYDILIDGFRSDQVSGGITPIEDYFLRDMLASWSHLCGLQIGKFCATTTGMWTTSRNIAATMITCVMPNYSTPYYGTSGMDGNSTVYAWAPFQTSNYTWKDYFVDHDYTIGSYPTAPALPFGLEGATNSDALIWPSTNNPAVWADKAAYASWGQCGHNIANYANMIAQFADINDHPSLLNYIDLITDGTLEGNKNPVGPTRVPMITLLNENFPTAAANATAWIQSLPATDSNSDDKQIGGSGPGLIAFYDDTYYGGTATPTVATPEISPAGSGGNVSAISVTMSCATSGATIRYTIDGSNPDSSDSVYSSALSISSDTTVKARGFLSGYNDSGVATETYSFGSPPNVPTGLAVSNVTASTVDLDWNTVSGTVTGYKIYTNGSNPATTVSTSITLTGLTPSTSYTFTVSAYNDDGESGQSSGVGTTTTSDTVAPSVPSGLASSNVTSTTVDLDWNASTDNVGVAGYKIYTDGSNPASVTSTSVTMTGLSPSTNYDFTVSAVDASANESSQSSVENVTTSAGSTGGGSALMIDFGPTTPTGSMLTNSPGHDTSFIDSGDDTWNVVATSGGNSGSVSSLYYADGSAASGVSFTYGASSSGSKVIDYTASIASSNNLGSGASTGVYVSGSVARDAIWNGGSSASDLSIGIRIDGLASGSYTAFVMARNTNSGSNNDMDVYAIAASSSSSYNFGSDTPTNISNASTASWIEDDNYAEISVTVGSGESLYIIADGAVSGGERGFLNAVQIVGEGSGGDTEAPSTPNGLASGNVTATAVDLSWNASTDNVGVTGYKVYINGSNPVSVSGVSTTITGLTELTNYGFTVSAVDAASNESGQSSSESVTTLDGTAPGVPTGLTASNITATTVDLDWNASTDNVAVTSYNIYIDGANPVSVSGTSATLTGLSPSTNYDFTVSALDAVNNESNQSSTANITTSAPVGGGNALMIDFGPTSPSGASLTNSPGHATSVIDSGDDTWNVAATSGGNSGTVSSLSYADGSTATGVSFTYGAASGGTTVVDFTSSIASSNNLGSNANADVYASGSVARDGIWNGGSSSSDLPIGIRIDGLDSGTYSVIVMARNTNAGTSSNDMDVYAVVASSSSSYNFGSDTPTNISNSSTASWIEDDNYAEIAVTVGSGESLYIITDGSVSGGERGFLNAVQIVGEGSSADTEAPSTPTGLTEGTVTTTTVGLSWNTSTDNVGVTGYKVYIDGSNPVSVSGSSTTITGLTQNTQYAFTVSAVDAAANESSPSSGLNVTTADGEAPSTPTGLAEGTVTSSAVGLSWNASTDNVGVTGYKVYIDGSSPVSVSGTSTTVTGLDSNTEYTFTVTAVDAAANESTASTGLDVTTATAVGALMIDFGPTSPSGSMLTNSPGHDTSTIDSGDDTWNVVATSGGNSGSVSSLYYADGSSASGVSFTYGASGAGSKVIDYTATIGSSSSLGSNANSGVYASGSVGRDGIWNGGSSTSDLSVGIRIDGLVAGTYTVIVMGRNTNSGSSNGMDVYALAASSSSSYNFGSDTPTNISNTSTSSWSEDDNYAEVSVSVSSGQSLYIITDGSDSGGQRGFLNAVQIVPE